MSGRDRIAAQSTVDRIVGAAEARVRAGGYHGFSFREIASDIGIKSASVHHHFATKEDLGVAVAEQYTDRFLEALGDPTDQSKTVALLLSHYVQTFRSALMTDGKMCLCGVLATESAGLPEPVRVAAKSFFDRNLLWLETVITRRKSRKSKKAIQAEAMTLLAALEGAMMLTISMDSIDAFDAVAKAIISKIST